MCVFGFKILYYNTHRNPTRHSVLKPFPQVKYPVTCPALSCPHKMLTPQTRGQPWATPRQSSPSPYTSSLVSLDRDSTWPLGQPHHRHDGLFMCGTKRASLPRLQRLQPVLQLAFRSIGSPYLEVSGQGWRGEVPSPTQARHRRVGTAALPRGGSGTTSPLPAQQLAWPSRSPSLPVCFQGVHCAAPALLGAAPTPLSLYPCPVKPHLLVFLPGGSHALPTPGLEAQAATAAAGGACHTQLGESLRGAKAGVPAKGQPLRGP